MGLNLKPLGQLAWNMAQSRGHPKSDEASKKLMQEQEELQKAAALEWAKMNDVHQVYAWADWFRLIGKSMASPRPVGVEWNLPADDHCSLWASNATKKPVLWVSHPYAPICAETLRDMDDAAKRYGLYYGIEALSWYWPGMTVMVIWCTEEYADCVLGRGKQVQPCAEATAATAAAVQRLRNLGSKKPSEK